MCGIGGFSGPYAPSLLSAMGERIAHRGPDDSGELFIDHIYPVGLLHRRLAIIDLSVDGHQPMTVNCQCCQQAGAKQLWLVYNGELYNYRELRRYLIAKGHHFQSQSDSEVILHLYADEGPDMLQRLNGIFAFAIYDGRPTGQDYRMQPGDLLLVRDQIGAKPLYYTQMSQGFLFASELKALLASAMVSRDLDLTAIHYYLAYLWCPGEQTALSQVKKVNPGEAMIIRHGQMASRWYYYDYPYHGHYAEQSTAEICHELDERLTRAVDRQLMADVPVGAFLSGGLDSSAVVAKMKTLRPGQEINCYTIDFADGLASEGNPQDLPYARAVADHLGVNLKVLRVEADMMQQLERMIYHLDEPQADPAPIHVMSIAAAARQDGIKVLLSGTGGDDIFSGYRRHQALYWQRYWQWLPSVMRQKLAGYARDCADGRYASASMRRPFARRFAKLFANCDLAADERIANYFLWGSDHLRRSLYSDEMQAQLLQTNTMQPLLSSLMRIPDESQSLNRMLYLEAKHFLSDHNLNYTDKMSMAVGVEVRVPLLDLDLIHFATQIPPRMKQTARVGKAIFKRAMQPYLPKQVIYRPKAGFGAPVRQWMHKQLRPMVDDLLSPSAVAARGLFSSRAINTLRQWDEAGRVDASYTLFSLLCIELWCQQFL